MFIRCLYCHQPFQPNEALEHFATGRRVAYDPGRGRLWAICEACHRWTLAPIEERWEALEELEKLTTDHGRLLSQTEHISLIRAEDLEIVRVGRARLQEEAWWRYGRELVQRRAHSRKLHFIQIGLMVALSAATAAAGASGVFGGVWGQNILGDIDRWRRFGRTAWRGGLVCPRCGDVLERISFKDADRLILTPGPEEDIALRLGCPRCNVAKAADSGFLFTGVGAEHVLRRVLAHRNFHGATEDDVRAATRAIEEVGSPAALARRVAGEGARLRDVVGKSRGGSRRSRGRRKGKRGADRTRSFALEIAVNDDTERRMLELELQALEERWREEEEIASISDNELTPLPRLNDLLTRLRIAPRAGEG